MQRTRLLRFGLVVAIYAAAGWALSGYITDDTFIHLRYAENLLAHGEFSFNPGQTTYGATSPLWIFGLALLLKLGLSPFAAAATLGGACGLLALALMERVVDRLTFPSRWKTAVLLTMVCDAWFLRWSWSGMETPLATALLIFLLWPLVSPRQGNSEPLWNRYLGWGVTAGLAGLVRPEFLLIAPLALPVLLWFEYYRAGARGGRPARYLARPYKPVLAAGSGWLLAVVPWFVYAWQVFGRILPETASAKSGSAAPDLASLVAGLWRGVKLMGATQGFLWCGLLVLTGLVWLRNRTVAEHGGLRPQPSGGETHVVPGVGRWSIWGPVAMVGIAVVWTSALLGGYTVKQVWLVSRYVCPLSPVILLAMALVGEWLLRGRAIDGGTLRRGRRILAAFVVLNLAANTWLFTTRIVPHARQFPAGVRECYLDLGYWLRNHTAEDAVIAALDIGALGYGSDREILDLMGLVSPEVLALGLEMGFAEMVDSGAWLALGPDGAPPAYFVDRSDEGPRWAGRTVNGVRFELLNSCVINGVGLRESQPWTVSLYRLVSTESRVKSSAGG